MYEPGETGGQRVEREEAGRRGPRRENEIQGKEDTKGRETRRVSGKGTATRGQERRKRKKADEMRKETG